MTLIGFIVWQRCFASPTLRVLIAQTSANVRQVFLSNLIFVKYLLKLLVGRLQHELDLIVLEKERGIFVVEELN
jgi:hypothetical protein